MPVVDGFGFAAIGAACVGGDAVGGGAGTGLKVYSDGVDAGTVATLANAAAAVAAAVGA